jgi:hypothetical protein
MVCSVLGYEEVVRVCEHDNVTSGSIKYLVSEKLSIFRGLCPTEFFN